MRLLHLSLLTAALTLPACGDAADDELATPRTPLSDELAGDWFTGSLSTIQYYDRTTGEWQDPSGSGFYYILEPDGRYETGAVIDSTVAGCTMRLLGTEVGTMEQDGDVLTVHRHWVRVHVTNSCGNSGERVQGEATSRLRWSVAPDANGLAWLTLTHDDGSVETYRPWTD